MGVVLVGAVVVLKISPNLTNARFCSTPNFVIVEAGCGRSSAAVSSCAALVAVSWGESPGSE